MAHTLEDLRPGTPVYCGDARIGEVVGLYSEGASRAVEWVVVHWQDGGAREVALPATEVEAVNERGVTLMHHDPKFYAELTTFSESRFPTARRL
jgi:hypothetical protein